MKLMKVTEVIETFYFKKKKLISVNVIITISFYIMPDYNHGIISNPYNLMQARVAKNWEHYAFRQFLTVRYFAANWEYSVD